MWLFLLKHWKGLSLAVIGIMVCAGMYFKGRLDCSRSYEKAAAKEIARRFEEYIKERDRTDAIKDVIEKHRSTTPVDDARDSCLLSNNPYSVDCLKSK